MAGGAARVRVALCFPAWPRIAPRSNEMSLETKRVPTFELGKPRRQQNLPKVVKKKKNKKQMAERPEASQVPLHHSAFFIIISN